jgi:hypothetical protein
VAEGCVPISLFGYNSITPAALKYVTAPGSLQTAITQKLAGATVTGEVRGLPAGAIGIAAGLEWRDEDSSAVPDPLTRPARTPATPCRPPMATSACAKLYRNARAPAQREAMRRELSFLGTFRHGDYSTVGSANSWNAGLNGRSRPTSNCAARAPSPPAHRISTSCTRRPARTSPTVWSIPREGININNTSALGLNCRNAPGVAANMAAHGGVFTLNQADQQGISGYNSGNPDLKAEKGRSTTVGLVVTPRGIPMLRKFTFTADYFLIKIADAIVATDRQYALDQCYNHNNPVFCSFIVRRPAPVGNLSAGSIQYSNLSDQ